MEPSVNAALEFLKNGDGLQAREICQQILKVDAQNARAWHLCGVTHAQVNELREAANCFARAVEFDNEKASYHYNLGLAHRGLGELDYAIAAYRDAIARKPDFLEAKNNLASTLVANGNTDEAIECFRSLAEQFPDDAVAHYNLGNTLQDSSEIKASIASFRRAVECDPDMSSARENLGRAFSDIQRFDEAKKVWEDWLTYDPNNSIAKHMLASVTGEDTPVKCDDEYVRQAFDVDFAETFEQQLAQIDYRGPALMKEAIDFLNFPSDATILDAGCGTGLSAPDLRPLATKLVGVDLSPDMLAKADQRKIYDELVEDELTRFFESRGREFDLVLCSDTLCYFGALTEVMMAARSCIKDSGVFIFSVERVRTPEELEAESQSDDAEFQTNETPPTVEQYQLQPNGRYRHVEDYVANCVGDAGFSIVRSVPVVLRMERGREVHGLVVTAAAAPDKAT